MAQTSDSFGCIDILIDEPGDSTVRPCDPRDLPRARAVRAKILAALKAGFRPYADTPELAEAKRLKFIAEYEAAIARDAQEQS